MLIWNYIKGVLCKHIWLVAGVENRGIAVLARQKCLRCEKERLTK